MPFEMNLQSFKNKVEYSASNAPRTRLREASYTDARTHLKEPFHLYFFFKQSTLWQGS